MEEKSTLKTILTLGGIFVGGYLLYRFFFVPTPRRGGGGGAGTGTGTGDDTPDTPVTPPTMFETLQVGGDAALSEGAVSKKNATSNKWDARAYSKAGTNKSCSITASPASSGGTMMIGLVTDPITRNVFSWTNMDYAFYFYGEGSPKRVEIWENGKNQGASTTPVNFGIPLGDYKPTDKFTVKYDAPTKTISYLVNGVEKKKTVVTSTQPLFGLATVYNGAGFKDVVLKETTSASFASADGMNRMDFFAPPGF